LGTSADDGTSAEATAGGDIAPPTRERKKPLSGEEEAGRGAFSIQNPGKGSMTNSNIKEMGVQSSMIAERRPKRTSPFSMFGNNAGTSGTAGGEQAPARRGAFSIQNPGKGPMTDSTIKEMELQSSMIAGSRPKRTSPFSMFGNNAGTSGTADGDQAPARKGAFSIQNPGKGLMTNSMIKDMGVQSSSLNRRD
jgi:hypothetical protein